MTFMSHKTVISVSFGLRNVLIKNTIFIEFYIAATKLSLRLIIHCEGILIKIPHCLETNWHRSLGGLGSRTRTLSAQYKSCQLVKI